MIVIPLALCLLLLYVSSSPVVTDDQSQRPSPSPRPKGSGSSHRIAQECSGDQCLASRSVLLRNMFDKSISVYMRGDVLVEDIPAAFETAVTVSVGDMLQATGAYTPGLVLAKCEITETTESCAFSHSRTAHTRSGVSYEYSTGAVHRPHPSVVSLANEPRSTCMSAKFRSLTPNVIDMYYDDGGDGVLTAILRMGQETTTNTYEGHVFYFTEHGQKHKEIVRFTMNSAEVIIIIVYSIEMAQATSSSPA